MSAWYLKIKGYYDEGKWNETMVRNAVVKGKITQDECDEIIGADGEQKVAV